MLLSIGSYRYLSEAGASLVDRKLNLNVVPKTRVVRLVAESFNYARIDRQKAKFKKRIKEHIPSAHFNRMSLPLKVRVEMSFYRNCFIYINIIFYRPDPFSCLLKATKMLITGCGDLKTSPCLQHYRNHFSCNSNDLSSWITSFAIQTGETITGSSNMYLQK